MIDTQRDWNINMKQGERSFHPTGVWTHLEFRSGQNNQNKFKCKLNFDKWGRYDKVQPALQMFDTPGYTNCVQLSFIMLRWI